MYYNILAHLFFFLIIFNVQGDEMDLFGRYRNSRNCQHRTYSAVEPFYRKSIFENTIYLIFVIILGTFFGLMFLGLIKGLLGIFAFKNFGEYGINMLIDLPKPLDAYQESDLKGRPVCYDVAGWPVHPDTGERTVKMLPMKTQFCLNIIFFLAYPLVIILKLCALCCCIRNYEAEEDSCFKEVNVIRCKGVKKNGSGPEVDRYNENDLREAKDTSYIINCMRQSQISIEKLNQSKEF